MTLSPNRNSVVRVVEGLNYKITKSLKNVKAGGAPETEIRLDKKMNQRELLSLSYYTLSILQHLVMDSVLGKILHTHYSRKNVEKLTIPQLEEKVAQL